MRYYIAVYLVCFYPAIAHADNGSLAAAWFDQTQVELKAVDTQIVRLETKVSALEQQLERAALQIESNRDCLRLDCREIKQLATEIFSALEAANASIALSRIAREELMQLADEQRKSLGDMARGRDEIGQILLYQKIAKETASLAAGIAVSLATGDVNSLPAQINAATNALVNYAANQGLDLATGHRGAVGSELQKRAGTNGSGSIADNIVGSIGAQLTDFTVVRTDGQGARLTLQHIAGSQTKTQLASGGASLVTGAVINALTEALSGPARDDFRNAFSAYQQAVAGQRDYELAVAFGAVAISMAQKRQREIAALADRISKLAVLCQAQARKSSCADRRDEAISAAKSARAQASGQETQAIESARKELEAQRADWQAAMDEAAKHHNQLRTARDELAEAERLSGSRTQIAELASGAGDSETRAKYQAELEKLNQLGEPSVLRARATELETKRNAARDRAEATLSEIAKGTERARGVYDANNTAIEKAEEDYRRAVSKAWADFYDCLGTSVSTLPEAPTPAIKELRAELTQEVDPSFIYHGLRTKLTMLEDAIGKARISARDKDGIQCQPDGQIGEEGQSDAGSSADTAPSQTGPDQQPPKTPTNDSQQTPTLELYVPPMEVVPALPRPPPIILEEIPPYLAPIP
jgi:hypothetical protein